MEIRFDGQKALVFGGARGLGKCVAETFAKNGADVIIGDVLDAEGEETCAGIREMGREAKYVHIDVTDAEKVRELYADIPYLDIMVNCVGITMTYDWLDAPVEKVQRLTDINIMGTSNVTQEALRKMIPQNHGKILLFASVAGRIADQTVPHYRMSKAAVLSMVMSAAKAAAKYNVNVNGLCPGLIRTPMNETQLLPGKAKQYNVSKDEAWDILVKNLVPMGRAQSPQDIANSAAFLCSSLADNITGQSLCVDGGQCMQI